MLTQRGRGSGHALGLQIVGGGADHPAHAPDLDGGEARIGQVTDAQGDVHAVVVRNGVVIHAPGELDLGRTTRLANRAQRRALRALYSTCAIPGCSVPFDHCKVHHVVWWRNGGLTDLANLLPICTTHHVRVHEDGWVLILGANRELTIRFPDGTIHITGPPSRRAAA